MTSPSLSRLVMNQRKLPAILRTDVPPPRIGGTPVQSLIAARTNLWGVLHSDIGKRICHKGCSVTIVNVHGEVRQIEDSGGERFWIPRRAANKKELRKQRIAHQFAQGIRKVFGQPCWTGEPRPKGARRVRVRTNYPSADYLRYLVHELGYNGHAAYAAVVRGHLPWLHLADRRRTKEGKAQRGVGRHPEHPFIPAAPNGRLTRGGGFRKEQVTAAIEKHSWDDAHSTAVFEVVYMRRKPFLVAASLGLKLTTVYHYASRVRADLRRGPTPKEKADLHTKSSKSLVFSECV